MEINFWNGQAIVAIFILTHFYYILLLDFSSFDLAYSASEVFPITKTWLVSELSTLPHPIPPLSLRMGCLPITNKSSYLAAWIKIFQGGGWQCKSKVSCPRTQHYVSSKKSHLLNSTLKTIGQRISHITLWLKVLTLWSLRVTSI